MSEYIYEHSRCHDHFGKPLDAPLLTQRERIVRCRNCQHVEHIPEWRPDGDRRYKPREVWVCRAEQWEGLEGDNPFVGPDGFCKWGERRGDAE